MKSRKHIEVSESKLKSSRVLLTSNSSLKVAQNFRALAFKTFSKQN